MFSTPVRPSVPGPRIVLLAIAVAFLAGSCGGSASAPTPAGPESASAPAGSFALASPAFAADGAIPARFTCDGADVSPPLSWTAAPAGTAVFVLLVEDPDAGSFVHWVAGPIAASATSLPEAVPAAGPPPQGSNGFGKLGWGGPCPPSGTHRYVFRLAALPAAVVVPSPLTAEAARALLARAIAVAELDAHYGRG